jgi:hypothetical protein
LHHRRSLMHAGLSSTGSDVRRRFRCTGVERGGEPESWQPAGETRVRAAERARFESSPVGRILSALGLSGLVVYRVRLTKRRVLSLAWALVPAKIKLVAGGLVATWPIALAALTAVAVVFAHPA